MIEIERLENSQYKYYAETDGKIYTKNKKTGEVTEKSSRINKDGYLDFKANKGTHILHRLIAEVFIPCDKNIRQLVVNHKDSNKLNNLPSNLEWCTSKYNIEHHYSEHHINIKGGVIIINKISKEVVDYYSRVSGCERKCGVWIRESLLGNSAYGNYVAVFKEEFDSNNIDEIIQKRLDQRWRKSKKENRKNMLCYYSGLTRITEKYNSKILPPTFEK